MRYKLIICLMLFVPGITAAQQTRFLTLEELFALGTDNSLRLNAARLQQNISESQVQDARTQQLPDIHIGGTTGYRGQPVVFQHGLTKPLYPDSPDWAYNYNVSVVQPIYEGGRIRYNIERAELQRQIATLAAADDEADVKMILLRQYLNLFTLYKQKDVFARNIEESERRLADINRMKKEGIVTRNDEIRSELELTNMRLTYRETEDNIAIVSQHLDILLGLDESLLLEPDNALLGKVFTLHGYEDYVEQAYDNYPGLNIARSNTAIARNGLQTARSAYLPSLSLQGGNTLARPIATTMQDMFSNNWNVVLSLSFNLSSVYQNRHKVSAAKYNVELGENREKQVMQELRVGIRSAYIRHQESLDRVKSLLLAVEQAEENYRIVHNRYMNQLSILTDLLDATGIRLQAEMQLTAARAESVYTYYELMRACGNI